jgi:lauroyl/myristoyl acyltransferase
MKNGTFKSVVTHFMRASFIAGIVGLPFYAHAQGAAEAKPPMPMNCPMMGNLDGMQKDLGGMMGDVENMMKRPQSEAAKERLQKMHERMAVMMTRMQGMRSMRGMMGNSVGGMMGDQQTNAPIPAVPSAPGDANR